MIINIMCSGDYKCMFIQLGHMYSFDVGHSFDECLLNRSSLNGVRS